eukprot:TRINITY_DN8012_c0_g1_i1.p1 TRINITY_DN8012_c0_g1~~TRINITY_DN8012_c0_g1_i1.p1  ORF type:complete len:107 (-),score=5.45 TRINITY_DN8012_c0_g1_i1:23-343(-)
MEGWPCSLCSDSSFRPLLLARDPWKTLLTTLPIPSTTTPGHMPPTLSPESERTSGECELRLLFAVNYCKIDVIMKFLCTNDLYLCVFGNSSFSSSVNLSYCSPSTL